MNWERAKLITEVIAPIASTVGLLAGGAYAIYEYWDHSQSEKAKQALVFIDRYYRNPVLDAQLQIQAGWNKHVGSLTKAATQGGEEYTQFVLKTIAAERLERDISIMVGFYESIGLCSRDSWCDKDLVKTFFCDPADDFFRLHYRYISAKRKELYNPMLGRELETFVNKTCRKEGKAK